MNKILLDIRTHIFLATSTSEWQKSIETREHPMTKQKSRVIDTISREE